MNDLYKSICIMYKQKYRNKSVCDGTLCETCWRIYENNFEGSP